MQMTRIRISVFGIVLLGAFFAPHFAFAFGSSAQYFGGMQTLIYDSSMCSCSKTNVHVIKDEASHSMLMLYDNGSGKVFNNNNLNNIGGWQLGSYTLQTTQCTQTAYPKCILIATATGVYSSAPGTGTSMIDAAKTLLAGAFTKITKNLTKHYANV